MNVWEKRRQSVKGGTGGEIIDIRERKKVENIGRGREVVNIRAWMKKETEKLGILAKERKKRKGGVLWV